MAFPQASRCLNGEALAYTLPQPIVLFVPYGQDDDRGVIVATGFICHRDEVVRQGLDVVGIDQRVKNVGGPHAFRESVRTEQQEVIREELEFSHCDVDIGLDAQRTCYDVALRGPFCLLFSEKALTNLLGHPGVIDCQRLNGSIPDKIEAAVSYMREGEYLVSDGRGDDRGAHPGPVRTVSCRVIDDGIGQSD